MKQLGSELPGQKPLMTVDEYLGPFPPDGKFNGNRALQAEGNLLAQKSFLLNEEPWEISFLQSIGVTLSASLDTEELLSGLFSILKKFFRGDVIAMEFAEKVASIGYVVSSDSVAPEILKEFSEHNSLSCFNESGKKLNGENCRTRYLYVPESGKDSGVHRSTNIDGADGYFAHSTSVSLKIEGMLVGTLTLYRVKEPFSAEEVRALCSVAEQTGQTLVNSLAYMKVVKLASRDGLTGLLNRRVFEEIMKREYQRAIRYSSPLSLVLIDIDHFKKINDSFGHQIGDFVLKEVASIMEGTIRDVDILARYGGEEFVLLLPGTQKELALNTAERVRECVRRAAAKCGDVSVGVSVSMGVSSLGPSQFDNSSVLPSVSDLICRADSALYEAKRGGRDMVVAFEEFAPVGGEGALTF